MEDQGIIALFWARSEEAILLAAEKYGAYCGQIIRRVLGDGRDAEECLSDTWLGAWNAMPPQRPERLPPFEAVLEELADCVGGTPLEEDFDFRRLGESISVFLDGVSPAARLAFLRRYWYCEGVAEIATGMGFSQSKVKSLLHRTRKGLREHLRKEGYDP